MITDAKKKLCYWLFYVPKEDLWLLTDSRAYIDKYERFGHVRQLFRRQRVEQSMHNEQSCE